MTNFIIEFTPNDIAVIEQMFLDVPHGNVPARSWLGTILSMQAQVRMQRKMIAERENDKDKKDTNTENK